MSCPMRSPQTSGDYDQNILMEKLPAGMQAIHVHNFGGPEVLKLSTNLPLPTFTENQVLIKVFTVGVNLWETYARTGDFGVDKLPFTPGSDSAGVVVRAGSKVTNVKCGQRVYTVKTVTGSYAQFTVADASFVFALHDDLTFSQGAALGVPYFTAYRALFFVAQCRRGETVLVHGDSGGVGLACCQIARAYGMNVLATAGSEKELKILQANHITSVFNHNSSGYLKQIEKHVGAHGVDIVCEMFAGKNLESDVSLVTRHGRIVVIGSQGQATFNPSELLFGEKHIQGVAVFSSTQEEYSQMATALDKGVEAGWLRPIISQEFPLAEAADAHVSLNNHPVGSAGKIILSL